MITINYQCNECYLIHKGKPAAEACCGSTAAMRTVEDIRDAPDLDPVEAMDRTPELADTYGKNDSWDEAFTFRHSPEEAGTEHFFLKIVKGA